MPDRKPPTGGKKIAGIDRKWWLIGGSIAVVAVGYSYHKAKQRAAATTATTTDPTADPSYSDPYGSSGYAPYASGSSPYPFSGIDPNTGVPYAQEVGAGGSTPQLGTHDAPFQLGGTITTIEQQSQTNATWMTAAVQALEHSGYTSTVANLSISQYLLGMPLTAQEVGAVQAAVSMVGPPPNPVALHTVGTPSTQGSGSVTQPQPTSNVAPPTPALSLSNAAGHEVHVSASKVPGAVLYEFFYGGSPHMAGPQSSYTSAPHPVGFHYGPVTVRAVSATGKVSPFSAPQSIVVK